MKKRFFLLMAILFLLPLQSQAAELRMESDDLVVSRGEIIEIRFYLDTQGELANTVSGKLSIDQTQIKFFDTEIGGSVIDIWAQTPKLRDNTLTFTGMTPGGFISDHAYLFSVYIMGELVSGSQPIYFEWENLTLYSHHGEHFRIEISPSLPRLTVSSAVSSRHPILEIDERQPESFQPIRVRTKQLYNGEPTLIFAAEDKQSGIDHYELLFLDEQKKIDEPFINRLDWLDVTSPLQLSERMADSYLYVKAVDKAGNSTVELLGPESRDLDVRKQKQIYQLSLLLFLTILIILIERMYLAVKRART